MHHVNFHRLAANEYRQARDRYEHQRPGLGTRFVEAVDHAVQRISDNPSQWPEYRPPFRWVKVRRFPYYLHFYIIDTQRALVLAVAHSRRRQGYWIRRKTRP